MIKSGTDYFFAAVSTESSRQPVDGKFRCPCCESLALSEAGGWEICDVCGWEDDPVQETQPDLTIGANGTSLNEARAEWARSQDANKTL